MKKNLSKKVSPLIILLISIAVSSCSQNSDSQNAKPIAVTTKIDYQEKNTIDDLNPFAPDIKQQLEEMDRWYIAETGKSPFEKETVQTILNKSLPNMCYRDSCTVFVLIKKSEQKMYLYVNQQLQNTWLVSTGTTGDNETPLLDKHPNGRIYDAHTSSQHPGGDYNGLGNMPYAVFIYEGFAIHGTGRANWRYLGRKASHGCIRLHPDNAFIFNRLVRQYGIQAVWVQVVK